MGSECISINPSERKSQIHETIVEAGPQLLANFLSSVPLK